MPSHHDVVFGRVALAAGLLQPDVLRQVYGAMPPGRTLGEELVTRRLLTLEQAHWVQAEAVKRSSGEIAVPQTLESSQGDSQATMMATKPGSGAPQRSPSSGSGLGQSGTGELPQPGDVIDGRYTLASILGKGGMGAVYRAHDTQRGEDVAVKVMLAGDEDDDGGALARFQREAEAVVQVDGHAGIVRVRAFGSHNGAPYAVQDLVEGRDLHEIVKEDGPLPIDEALAYTEQVARAIHHCHQRGVVHRDLKPANVLLRTADKTPHVTDFGLALDASAERLTKTGEVMGTPAYMSPEQAEGLKDEIDALTDVYALGAILYELVTGRAPFAGDQVQILKQVFMNRPAPVGEHRSEAPDDLDAICQMAMAKEKAWRYADAAAFADDVGALLRGAPIEARPPTKLEEFRWKVKRRDTGAMAVVVAGFLAVITLVAGPVAYFMATGERALLVAALTDDLPKALEGDPLLGALDRRTRRRSAAAKADVDPQTKLFSEIANRARTLAANVDADDVTFLADAVRAARAGDDAAAAWLVEAETAKAGTIERLDRLVTRVAFHKGLGWRGSDALRELDDPNAKLLRALELVRWGLPYEEYDATRADELATDVAAAISLLEQARSITAAQELLSGEHAPPLLVEAFLGEGAKAVIETFTKNRRSAGTSWRTWESLTAEAPAGAEHFLVGLLYMAKRAALTEFVKAIQESLPPKGDSRWNQRRPYGRVQQFLERHLYPFTKTHAVGPPLTFQATKSSYTEILLVLFRRTAHVDFSALGAGFLDLLQSVEKNVDWSDPEVQRRVHDLLAKGSISFIETRAPGRLNEELDRTIVRLLMIAPRVGRMPLSGNFEPIYKELEETGQFQRHLTASPSGDGYLVYARTRSMLGDRGTNAPTGPLEEVAGLYAQALGDLLGDDEWTALGLGERPTLPAGTTPLTPVWEAQALYWLGALGMALGNRDEDGRKLGRMRASVALLERAYDKRGTMRSARRASALKFIPLHIRTLRLSLPEGSEERARLTKREDAIREEAMELNWSLLRSFASGEIAKRAEEGFHGVDSTMDHTNIIHHIANLCSDRQRRLMETMDGQVPQIDAARALLRKTQEDLAELGYRDDPDLADAEAWFFVYHGTVDEAEGAGKRLRTLGHKILRGADVNQQTQGAALISRADCVDAHVAFRRGDKKTATELYWKSKETRRSGENHWQTLASQLGISATQKRP